MRVFVAVSSGGPMVMYTARRESEHAGVKEYACAFRDCPKGTATLIYTNLDSLDNVWNVRGTMEIQYTDTLLTDVFVFTDTQSTNRAWFPLRM